MSSSRESPALVNQSPSMTKPLAWWIKGRQWMQSFWISVWSMILLLTASFWMNFPTVRFTLHCVMNWLDGRALNVVVNGATSARQMIPGSVLQGSF